VALNRDSITTNHVVARGAGTPGSGGTAEIAGQSVGGGGFLTDPGSTALNTTITENEAATDPNVYVPLGRAAAAASGRDQDRPNEGLRDRASPPWGRPDLPSPE